MSVDYIRGCQSTVDFRAVRLKMVVLSPSHWVPTSSLKSSNVASKLSIAINAKYGFITALWKRNKIHLSQVSKNCLLTQELMPNDHFYIHDPVFKNDENCIQCCDQKLTKSTVSSTNYKWENKIRAEHCSCNTGMSLHESKSVMHCLTWLKHVEHPGKLQNFRSFTEFSQDRKFLPFVSKIFNSLI